MPTDRIAKIVIGLLLLVGSTLATVAMLTQHEFGDSVGGPLADTLYLTVLATLALLGLLIFRGKKPTPTTHPSQPDRH